jgi:ASC-1-like (ASCH) protein
MNRYKQKYLKSKASTKTVKLHLSEPWFTLIALNIKTVEGRKNKLKFKDLTVGDTIQFYNDDFMLRTVETKIVSKTIYSSFREYLIQEGIDRCVPGQPTLNHALSVYYKYYSEEDVADCGVASFTLQQI